MKYLIDKIKVIIERKPQYESEKDIYIYIYIYIYLLINLLISNNFSSMTFFCATRILLVVNLSVVKVYDSQPIGNYWKKTSVRIWKRFIPLLIGS